MKKDDDRDVGKSDGCGVLANGMTTRVALAFAAAWILALGAGGAEQGDASERQPSAGERFRDCPDCPAMVVVPAGSYRMGSVAWENGRDDDEGPVHDVTFAAPFALGVYEVTVAEFGRFVAETGYSAASSCWSDESSSSWRNPGFGQSGGHPVVCVSWSDAKNYAEWLRSKTGEVYRLASESEWEYAARTGTTTPWPWGLGEADQCRHANGRDASTQGLSGGAGCNDGHSWTAPVGSYAANAWGLHDMLGNALEWTEDCYNGSYAGAPSDGSVWEDGDCTKRVLRGGSWSFGPSDLRAAFRARSATGYRLYIVGFRVARTLAP